MENVEKNPEIYVGSNNSIEKDLDRGQRHQEKNMILRNNNEHKPTNAKSEDE